MAKNALISSHLKDPDLVMFVRGLIVEGFKIWATRGTATFLQGHDLDVTDIAEITGSDPVLGHQTETLDRKIHVGLTSPDTQDGRKELEQLGVPYFDLLYVDMNPLEIIDVGGTAMLLSAIKGERIVVCLPGKRLGLFDWIKNDNPERRRVHAGEAAFLLARRAIAVTIFCKDQVPKGTFDMVRWGDKS